MTSKGRTAQPTPIDLAREARRLKQLRQAASARAPHNATAAGMTRGADGEGTPPRDAA